MATHGPTLRERLERLAHKESWTLDQRIAACQGEVLEELNQNLEGVRCALMLVAAALVRNGPAPYVARDSAEVATVLCDLLAAITGHAHREEGGENARNGTA